jgi:hypothetical protein
VPDAVRRTLYPCCSMEDVAMRNIDFRTPRVPDRPGTGKRQCLLGEDDRPSAALALVEGNDRGR